MGVKHTYSVTAKESPAMEEFGVKSNGFFDGMITFSLLAINCSSVSTGGGGGFSMATSDGGGFSVVTGGGGGFSMEIGG